MASFDPYSWPHLIGKDLVVFVVVDNVLKLNPYNNNKLPERRETTFQKRIPNSGCKYHTD